jgi:predicted transcriptional regulator
MAKAGKSRRKSAGFSENRKARYDGVVAKKNQKANPKPVFDEIDKDAEAQAIAEAEADIEAGRIVPHEDVVKWLESWGKANERSSPVPPKR